MSQSIDERVVSMKFDNRQFERGVEKTLKDVEKLNRGLKFEGASEGLEKVNEEIKKFDNNDMGKSFDVVTEKINHLGAVGFTVIQRLTNAVIDFGKRTIDTFAIRPVTTGFDEYGLKMGAVSTIMGATGASIQEINKYLDELNEYSDKTIYSFSDMTNNIGKFTNAGVKLEDAVAAIKGISSEAALAGANANEASRAMYNFAQALSTGAVKLIDWKSIENANMATVGFKEELLKTAEEIGTVVKDASGMYQVLTTNASGSKMKEAISATRNFNDSLAYSWMTSEVLIETLKKYSNEETEIGKQAMEAATEVKTFSDMINTLAESAQSGWAATWESIIGDYQESKKTWTELTKFFDEIISGTIEARNNLIVNAMNLQNGEGMTGRQAIWQSLLNILEAVRDVIGAVKQAWEDIFPPMTDQRLRGIIESFYKFSQSLKMNEDRLNGIRDVFRGIFAILDMFVTIIRYAFRVATKLVTGFANVLGTVLFTGFALLLQWIENIRNAETGFNGWLHNIIRGIKNFVGYVKSLEGFSLTNLFKAMFAFGSNVLARLFDPDSVLMLFVNLGKRLASIFKKTEDTTTSFKDKMNAIFKKLVTVLLNARNKLVEGFSNLSFDRKVILGISIVLALLVLTLRSFVKSITGIFESISGVFDKIGGVFKDFSKRLKAESMYTMSKTFMIMVSSLAVLMILASKKDQLYTALAVLGVIAAGMVGIMFIMSKMNKMEAISFAATIVGFSVAVRVLADTLGILQEFSGYSASSFVVLTALATGLLLVAKTLGNSKKQYGIGALTMLGFVMSLRLMIGVLKSFDELELLNVVRSIKLLLTIASAMALVGIGFKNVKFGASAALIASALSIKMLVGLMESFDDLSMESINRSLKIILTVFAGFALVAIAARSSNLKYLGTAALEMSVSLLIVKKAMDMFYLITPEQLEYSGKIISKILLIFGLLTAVSFFAGPAANQAGKMIVKMSTAIMLLSGVMIALSLFVESGHDISYAFKIISQLMVIMGLIIAATKLIPITNNVVKTFTALRNAVLVMAAAIIAMSFISDQEKLMQATQALALMGVVFALVIASTGLAKKATGTIILLTTAIVALGAMLALISYWDLSLAIENAGSIAILITSLAASMVILGKAEQIKKGLLGKLIVMSGIMMALGGVIGLLEKYNVRTSIENAVAIGVLLNALAASFVVLKNADKLDWELVAQVGVMSLITFALATFIGVLDTLNVTPAIMTAIAVGILINTLAASFLILKDTKKLDWGEIGQLAIMAAIAAGLGALVGTMDHFEWGPSVQTAITIGVLIVALSFAFKQLDGVKVDWSTIAQIGVMALIVVAFSALMALVGKLVGTIEIGTEVAESMVILLQGMAKACVSAAIAGSFGSAGFIGIGVLLVFIAAMTLLMIGIGELVRKFPNIMEDLDFAIQVFNKIGTGLGSFLGGFVNGVLQSIQFDVLTRLGEDMNGFFSEISSALETLNGVDASAFDKIGTLAKAMLALTAAELLDGISKWLGLGSSSLSSFGNQLGALGEGLKSFSQKTKGINTGTDIDNALDLLNRLIEASGNVENSGGWLGEIVGDNDLDDFGNQLGDLADGLVAFCTKVQGLPYNIDVDNAIDVMKKLANASKEIPNTGGWLGDIVGNNDMSTFAAQMPWAAQGIVQFCENIQGLKYDETLVNNACSTIRKLAAASRTIPNMGGWLADFVGDNKLEDFAIQLPKAGTGVKAFCNNIKGLDTTNVDSAISVLMKLADFEKTLQEKGGFIGDVFGETDMELFGKQLGWMGYYLWVYSTWIDSIKDYDKIKASIDLITIFSDVAKSVSGIDYSRFEMFVTEMIQFAKEGLLEFTNVFKNAKTDEIGSDLSKGITDSLHKTRTKFVSEGNWLVEGFLSGIKIKMSAIGGVKDVGRELGEKFLEGMTDGLEVQSPSKRTEWIGKMSILGFTRGLIGNELDVYNAGVMLGDFFMEGAQDRLGIHSPSEEAGWLGSMTTEGFTQGLTSGFSNLLGSFDGLWGKMQGLASNGMNSIKDIIGEHSLWDFSSGFSDNLVNAKDKLKEWLGFGDVGGLSDLFGFGSMDEVLEEEIVGSYSGIQDGMAELANDISSDKGGSISNLSDALKLSLHKHFDSREFIYLGQQIGEGMAIAANNAIVSNEKAMTDTLAEVISISAGGLETWKAWLEVRKAYDQVSQKDQLAGWALIQKMYVEGSKERMEADQEVYNLQKELVKGTFDYSKKWIDNEKYYERLSLEEELAAWERIQARYLEGSEERIEAEKEVYRIKKEIRQKDFEDAKKWIEREKKFERLSLADELAAYLRIQKTTEEGSDERLEMDEKIYDLQKSIYEAEQQYIKDVEDAQREAADERVRLEEEYAEKVREINEKLTDDIRQLNENYANEVENRRKSLYSAYGLFDAVDEKEFDKDELMQNLEDQVRAFEEWQMTLNSLASRGLDKALIDELTEMGPSASGQIKALNEMTDAELGQYNLLWSEKSSMAREQAISELEDLRVQTSENIALLQQSAAEELDDYRQTWADAMSKVTEDCNTKLEELRKDFGETVGTIKKDTDAKMREMAESASRILKEAGWTEAGEQIVEGVQQGIEKKKGSLITVVAGLASTVVTAFKTVLKIKSPSKVMEESGQYAAEGIIQGLASYYDKAWESGNILAEEIQNGALEAIRYVNDLVENGMEDTFTLTPVLDFTNIRSGINDMNTMLDTSKAVKLATSANVSLDQSRDFSFINPNEKVVQELQELRRDLGKLGEQVSNMQLVMDTGAVVGEITGPLDTALGSRIGRNTRERG